MSPRKRSILREPTVIVAIITVVIGGIITGVFGLISKSMETSNGTSDSTNSQSPADIDYAMQLLADAQHWQLVAKDGFVSNNLEWAEGDKLDNNVDATRIIENRVYSWRLKGNTKGAILKSNPTLDVTPDFYLAVDAQNVSQQDTTAYGLTFRDQGYFNLYNFIIYSDQHFSVRYKNDGENINVSLASLKSKHILPYEINRLAVIGKGQEFWFYINDNFVHYLKDDRLSAGTFGVVVTVKDIGNEGLVEFDNFELRKSP